MRFKTFLIDSEAEYAAPWWVLETQPDSAIKILAGPYHSEKTAVKVFKSKEAPNVCVAQGIRKNKKMRLSSGVKKIVEDSSGK